MTGPDYCQSTTDLLGVYALDALDAAEADRVRAHLAGCPRCTQEVDRYQDSVGLLGAADAGEAPAGVWDAIASSIDTTPGPKSQPPAPVLRLRGAERASYRRRSTMWLAGVAAAAAAALIGVQTVRVDHLDRRVNQLSAAAEQSGGFQGVAAALVDPSAKHVALTSTRPGGGRLGELVILPSGAAYLIAANIAALPEAETYQLWSVVAGRAISVGVLGARPATVAFSIDRAVSATAFLVTVEPAGGVVAPTSAPLAHAVI